MKVLKWVAIIAGALLAVLIVAALVLHFMGRSRLNRAPEVAVVVPAPATDPDAVARGEHLVHSVGACIGCHGANLEGTVFIEGAPIGYIPAPNLTSGAGGIGGQMSDEQWAAALRHGVGHDGRALAGMPSNAYTHMSDADLSAVIAYLKQVPPVDNDLGPRRFQFPGTVLFGVLGANALPVNIIDHEAVGGGAIAAEPTAAYGEYLVNIAVCHDCHAANLAGNTDPNGPPMGPNITPGGRLADYNENQFLAFMRSGTTPDGRKVSDEMPWIEYQGMTDAELQAIFAYVSGLAAVADNE